MGPRARKRSAAPIGWSVVGLQALLIVGAVVPAGPTVWTLPSWVPWVATAVALLALALAAVALLGLGRAATATPVPRAGGELRTDGLYGLVRHPIYTGVIVAIGAWALASGSIVRIACWCLLILLFALKARWEETMLVETYPEYPAYRERTPMFIPRLRPPRRG